VTVRERILAYLRGHPEGVDDDALGKALNLSRRQHANNECNNLARLGLLQRRPVSGKIRNFLAASTTADRDTAPESYSSMSKEPAEHSGWRSDRAWFWEGNVQAIAEGYLQGRGYQILKAADTTKKEQGKDIIAVSPSDQELWVSAKGRPEGTPKTTPYTQARHYFADALRDLAVWRGQSRSASLAVALPDFVTYRNQVTKVASQLGELKASVIWVKETGEVEASPDWL
jgi:hypothetical protein